MPHVVSGGDDAGPRWPQARMNGDKPSDGGNTIAAETPACRCSDANYPMCVVSVPISPKRVEVVEAALVVPCVSPQLANNTYGGLAHITTMHC